MNDVKDKLDVFLDEKEKELGFKLPDGVRIDFRAIVNSHDRNSIILRYARENGKCLSILLVMEYLSKQKFQENN